MLHIKIASDGFYENKVRAGHYSLVGRGVAIRGHRRKVSDATRSGRKAAQATHFCGMWVIWQFLWVIWEFRPRRAALKPRYSKLMCHPDIQQHDREANIRGQSL